jgi:hypothetical protein
MIELQQIFRRFLEGPLTRIMTSSVTKCMVAFVLEMVTEIVEATFSDPSFRNTPSLPPKSLNNTVPSGLGTLPLNCPISFHSFWE